MNELGYCPRPLSLRPPGASADSAGRCGGELSISAGKVKCEQCGFIDEAHPVAVAEAAARAALKALPPPTHDVPAMLLPVTLAERMAFAEKKLDVLKAICDAKVENAELRDRLAALEAKITKKARDKAEA